MIYPFFGELFLNGFVLLAILLIVVLKLSDRAARKLDRQILAWRARAKERYQKSHSQPQSPAIPNQVTRAAPPRPEWLLRRVFRVFRWGVVLLAIAAAAVFIPQREKVNASGPPPKPSAAVVSPLTDNSGQTRSSSDLVLSLWYTDAPAAQSAEPMFDLGHISLWGEAASGSTSHPISFSAPQQNPEAPGWLPRNSAVDVLTLFPDKPSQVVSPARSFGALR